MYLVQYCSQVLFMLAISQHFITQQAYFPIFSNFLIHLFKSCYEDSCQVFRAIGNHRIHFMLGVYAYYLPMAVRIKVYDTFRSYRSSRYVQALAATNMKPVFA